MKDTVRFRNKVIKSFGKKLIFTVKIKQTILTMEEFLGLESLGFWHSVTPESREYIMARMGKGEVRKDVPIAYYEPAVNQWLSC